MANIAHRAPRGAGGFFFAAIHFFSVASLHAQPAPALKLIPMPREVHPDKVLPLARGILVRTGSSDAEDRFTAEDLRTAIKERGVPVRPGGTLVELLRANNPSARALLRSAHQ